MPWASSTVKVVSGSKIQARVLDEQLFEMPAGLYIPPEALRVFLESFEGPLDLLLYLVKKQNLDILAVKVSIITEQYMNYIELAQSLQLDLAAEYLLMAALLTQIKSQKLLPQPQEEDVDADDPRIKLLEQLQTYEQFRLGAKNLEALPRIGREFFDVLVAPPKLPPPPLPQVSLEVLLEALQHALNRAKQDREIVINMERISTRERVAAIMAIVSERQKQFVPFTSLCVPEQGRLGVVATFLALLELMKDALVEVVQSSTIGVIQVRTSDYAPKTGYES